MRKLVWQDPNFRCLVRRQDNGEEEDLLVRASSAAELQTRMATRGYDVLNAKPYDFGKWRARAKAATDEVIANGKPDKWKDTIWSALKQYLYLLSENKCGYCEVDVFPVSLGEVEHYRPKGRVDEDTAAKHQGYYWLAYDPNNYVPTCPQCNGGKGKTNRFPISGKRSTKPGDDLAAEKPLLLNPFHKESPAKHLRFHVREDDPAFGQIKGRTPTGKKSEEIYRLNRGGLLTSRKQELTVLLERLRLVWGDPQKLENLMVEIEEARRPYAGSMIAAVLEWLEEMTRQSVTIRKRLNQKKKSPTHKAAPSSRRRTRHKT